MKVFIMLILCHRARNKILRNIKFWNTSLPQRGAAWSHDPFSRHVRTEFPSRLFPTSHVNMAVVLDPSDESFMFPPSGTSIESHVAVNIIEPRHTKGCSEYIFDFDRIGWTVFAVSMNYLWILDYALDKQH